VPLIGIDGDLFVLLQGGPQVFEHVANLHEPDFPCP
jgi:hypothetical protein